MYHSLTTEPSTQYGLHVSVLIPGELVIQANNASPRLQTSNVCGPTRYEVPSSRIIRSESVLD
jgi:hypothetical protein